MKSNNQNVSTIFERLFKYRIIWDISITSNGHWSNLKYIKCLYNSNNNGNNNNNNKLRAMADASFLQCWNIHFFIIKSNNSSQLLII